MLKILLDEHISKRVAAGLQRRSRSLIVHTMANWQEGGFLGQEDDACLRKAAEQGMTLVTYDRRTIPSLLKRWAEEGRSHAGVIFVDEKTIAPSDVGGLIAALVSLTKETSRWNWTDRVCFLRR